jgi:hypothetical protein
MTDDPAEITSFRLTLYLGATVDVQGEAWVKPSASTSITWNTIPDSDQVQTALSFMETQILTPTLNEVMATVIENTKKAKGIRDNNNPYEKG